MAHAAGRVGGVNRLKMPISIVGDTPECEKTSRWAVDGIIVKPQLGRFIQLQVAGFSPG